MLVLAAVALVSLALLAFALGDLVVPAVLVVLAVWVWPAGRLLLAMRDQALARRGQPSTSTDPTRRRLLLVGSASVAGAIGAMAVGRMVEGAVSGVRLHTAGPTKPTGGPLSCTIEPAGHNAGDPAHQHLGGTVGEVDHVRNGFHPTAILDDWDLGRTSTLPNGQVLREYLITAQDRTIEVAPGVFFEAWTYNGRVPGPTIRAREGDRIRVEFVNGGSHPHTIHFHGIHSAAMDGVPGQGAGNIKPGESTVYEFDAFPFGCHLYHCHTAPLKRHIHKGLYGGFVIDPDPARHPEQRMLAERRTLDGARAAGIRELFMIMNAFDTNFDGENEIYAANTVAFHFANHPIRIGTDEDVRLYLVNVTEFDPLNSLHLHANFFDYYDHGTTLEPTIRMIDTVMQCQAQRGILEFSYRHHEPGGYMFHAHQSEFVELGWMSQFDLVPGRPT